MFEGSIVALITPMHDDGAVDWNGLSQLVEWQIAQGTQGLVPTGTTGESPTLTHDEHKQIVELVVRVAAGRVPVIAGTGSNSTAEAIDLTRHARDAGANAALVVTPYYNKPTQEGLYLHFAAIADAVDLPIILYNIPGRSVVDMSVDTIARLAAIRNIVGIKDATANLLRPLQIRRACGAGFIQLSGEDHTAIAHLASGGAGCISVTGNIAPGLCSAMQRAWAEGQLAEALALQDRLLPLHDALFCETSPVPVKYGASLLGFTSPHCRLPLAPALPTTLVQVRDAMTALDLI